jgi:1,4-dihydroxy-2-naphthoyl-CoA hydrolase
MHFHQLLRWCHEAYEESLEKFGIAATEIFPTPGWHSIPLDCSASRDVVALPIIRCGAEYLHPLICGDLLHVELRPQSIDIYTFEIFYLFNDMGRATVGKPVREVANATTCHRAINAVSRKRCKLPDPIKRWLEASAFHAKI